MLAQLTLSPALATTIFVLAILAGHRFRRNWKEEGPVWKYWVYGAVAATGLLSVALVPVQV
ncbi:MAG: hypothetical protein AAFN09_05535 [Pseudomonadota bacterium]